MRYPTALVAFCLVAGMAKPSFAEPPRNPEGILAALEGAYAAGDVDAVRALMAPEYEFLNLPEGTGLSADQELRGLERLFAVARVTLTFSRDFELRPTPAGTETWVLRDVPTHLQVAEKQGKTYDVDVRDTFFVRRDPESGGIWIFRWLEEPLDPDR